MLTLEVTDRYSVPDARALDLARTAVKQAKKMSLDYLVYVGTATYLAAFRLLVAEGSISPNEIILSYEGKNYEINEYGAISDLPQSCLNEIGNLSERIIRTALSKRREKKGQASL